MMKYINICILLLAINTITYADEYKIDKELESCIKKDYSTVGTNRCIKTATEKWDKKLNKTYIELSGNDNVKLKSLQKAWMKFRDEKITYLNEVYLTREGSMWINVFDSAVMDITKEQTLFLLDIKDKKEFSTPITVGGEATLDPCGYGKVMGLKKDGDGFLAVRSTPEIKGIILDKLHNDNDVWICDQRGKWIGIVYGNNCGLSSPIAEKKEYDGVCKSGWVYEKWITFIAG